MERLEGGGPGVVRRWFLHRLGVVLCGVGGGGSRTVRHRREGVVGF